MNPWAVRNAEAEETEGSVEATEEVGGSVEAAEGAEEIEGSEEVVDQVDLVAINAGAVTEGVDRLVDAINSAVATIEDLRDKNAELEQQNRALKSDISRLEEEQVELCDDRDRLQEIYNDNAHLIDNKADILNKIEAMEQLLNSLNPEKNE